MKIIKDIIIGRKNEIFLQLYVNSRDDAIKLKKFVKENASEIN